VMDGVEEVMGAAARAAGRSQAEAGSGRALDTAGQESGEAVASVRETVTEDGEATSGPAKQEAPSVAGSSQAVAGDGEATSGPARSDGSGTFDTTGRGSGEAVFGPVKADGSAAGKRFLWVGNKVDAMKEDAARRKFPLLPDAIFISAKEGRQVDLLKQRLVDQVLQGNTQTEGTIVTNARHYHALQQVAESLQAIRKGLDNGLPGDLLALDIRHCLHYLGEITGEITSEDRLDYIFSKFCIGK